MSENDQGPVVDFLRSPAAFGGRGPVEVVETHGAYVFLCGDEALKLKRAVRYDYMDLSTRDKREALLRRELELNAPQAAEIYRDVLPVTRERGGLALGGSGEPVDWVLRMWRFRAEDELELIAERGGMTDALADALGRSVADYHAAAPLRDADGAELIGAILEELRAAFAGMRGELGAAQVEAFDRQAAEALARIGPALSARGRQGHVRRCHGDLHLRNLVLIGGRPVPFDALEFDETLGTCDVLYDLAFLLMDLLHRDLGRAANIVLGAYLFAAGGTQDAGLGTLPLFLAVRAAIRAMVDVQSDRARHAGGASESDARRYLGGAVGYLRPEPARLVAVGGLSGSGKTTLAREVAHRIGGAPGAVHLRTDVERKALQGVDPMTRLPPESYTRGVSREVYRRLLERAEAVLSAGHAALLDAAFLDPAERQAAEALAQRLDVPFAGLWLEADPAVLLARVAARSDDASDADAAVVRRQLDRDLGPMRWTRVAAEGPLPATAGTVAALLGL